MDPITRLNAALEGRYRIESELGEGGMANVYLADDLKHERKVALKVLKPELAAVVGAERFLAEIKTTANLQHPHILPLFDSGEADSFLFYVMPFVEGETLRDRLEREKQLPVDEAVRIATDVAEALHSAHKQGVIHRDIKPANILMSEGRPLVADFGIALAVSAAGGGRLTETGLSMGTPFYMSPEQASADREPSAASDVYSLGCVLYEMLVGEPPYTGGSAQAVLAKILTEEARAPSRARASIPTNVDAAIRKSLEKLPADRFAGAQDFAKALDDAGFQHGDRTVGVVRSTVPWRGLSATFASLFLIATAVAGWALLRPEPPLPVEWFPSPFLEGQGPTGPMQLTADGSALVYVGPAAPDEVSRLWLRRWTELDATPIPGTEGAEGTLGVSPDGTEVAFFSGSVLKVAPIGGGPTRTLAESPGLRRDGLGASASGLGVTAWTPDGWVYFGGGTRGIARVPEEGGVADIVVERDGEAYPIAYQPLPGGKIAVFQIVHTVGGGESELWTLDVETGERTILRLGNSPRVTSGGQILFGTSGGTLMVAPIDPATGQLIRAPVSLHEGLGTSQNSYEIMNYSVSETGTLVFRTGQAGGSADRLFELIWVDRSGGATPVDPGWTFTPGQSANAGWSLSPTGDRVAFQGVVAGNRDIWIKELPDGPPLRITFSEATERMPRWAPDGQTVTYRSGDIPTLRLMSKSADGTGEERVHYDREQIALGFWSPDGEWLILRKAGSTAAGGGGLGARDVLGIRPEVDSVAIPLAASEEYQEQGPAISRDGRWLAYTSNETGTSEVFVRPFPDVDSGKWPVSSGGGIKPLWAHSSREIFYVNGVTGDVVAARFDTSESQFRVVDREILFTMPQEFLRGVNADFYDVALDDQRFLMARPYGFADAPPTVILVQNFFEELGERMGGN